MTLGVPWSEPAEEPSTTPPADRPRLRLVPPHEHDWRLRDVDYVDGFPVRRFECEGCGEVDFS